MPSFRLCSAVLNLWLILQPLVQSDERVGSAQESKAPLPLWHTQFRVEFNETMKVLFLQIHTTGVWYVCICVFPGVG